MKHGKVDANQAEIVDALSLVGCSVQITSDVGGGFPDLVVGYRGQTYLIEVKTGRGRLTPAQEKWHALWRGQVAIVRSRWEALAVVGAEISVIKEEMAMIAKYDTEEITLTDRFIEALRELMVAE